MVKRNLYGFDNRPHQIVLFLFGMNIHGVTDNFVFNTFFYLQILGAFADHDGVPMQGMKIKNVVPGRNSFLCLSVLCFVELYGAVDRICVPRLFAFATFDTRINSFTSSLLLLLFVCEVRGGKNVGALSASKDLIKGALESDIQYVSHTTCDK